MVWALSFWSSAQLSADELYKELDHLVAKPTIKNLQRLEGYCDKFNLTVKSSNQQLALVIARANLGYYFERYGDLSKSIDNYEDAYHRFKSNQLSDYNIYENVAVPLAAIYIRQGDYLKAEELLIQCASHAKNTANNSLMYNTVLSLSALYNSTSRYERSYLLINETLKKKGIPPGIAAALKNNLATSYFRAGDFEKAKQLLSEIQVLAGIDLVNTYKSLAYIALKEAKAEEAMEYFEMAKSTLSNKENVSARDWVNLLVEESELLLELGYTLEAQNTLHKALSVMLPSHSGQVLPDETILYPERNFLRIFDIYAATTETVKDALRAYDLAFYVANLIQQDYSSQETKIIHQGDIKHRTEKCLNLIWKHYSDSTDTDWAEKAFAYAEQGKASVLMEKMVLNGQQNEKASTLVNLQSKRDKITDQLLRAQFKNLDDNILDTFISELADIDRQIKKVRSNLPKMLRTELNLVELQQKLKSDEAVLQSYFLGEKTNYHFTIDNSGIRMYRLPDIEELSPYISKFVDLFDSPEGINNNVPNFTKSAHELFELLQLRYALNNNRLVLIPDGLLNFLPFESLLTEPAEGTIFSKMPFLAVSEKVAYAVNAQHYLTSRSTGKIKSVLGIFPIFRGSPEELSYSEKEAKALGGTMSTELVMESQATKSNFIKKTKNHDLIHLSTHAGSGDFIIPAFVQFYDDLLYLPELHSLDMSDKTIVLSACETGIGKLQKGEGAISVARGFQYAGASSVLFSLWKVNDQSTASLMSRFYKSLSTTASVFASNHAAKLSYLRDENVPNSKKSPYYWNAFAYYGALDSYDETNNTFWWWSTSLLFVGFLVIVFGFRKKRD
ncbi:CHAT domain-containing protein [Arenibacter troitsensis]|uniref:CHAT domain-containing protein n=1 Tax=Arenibacter troitsensis TaxID=188872 RepID=A0A1X7L0T1_9FLAO|nr:CHAT domain-containing protein [Arenibacter troitsensis]SMG47295.1 CHAT domain-containing protein [Arenibacter troitsensis]